MPFHFCADEARMMLAFVPLLLPAWYAFRLWMGPSKCCDEEHN